MATHAESWSYRFRQDEHFLARWVEEGKPVPRIGIFVVTYNHVTIIPRTLRRIPRVVLDLVEEIFIFDDASQDDTQLILEGFKKVSGLDKITIHRNPRNLGYGGNQKAGYLYAIGRGLEVVVLLHGDGQYAPEALPSILRPVLEERARVVMGSRMLIGGEALKGGMPLYKYVGNRVLSSYQNALLEMGLSEFHSGYRLYSTEVLRRIPFTLASDDFHFDTEIIIQLHALGERIREVAIPSYYGEEICYVNGLQYAWNVARTTLEYALARQGLLEVARYQVSPDEHVYPLKEHPLSSHRQIVDEVPEGSVVLDLGCGEATLLPLLAARHCEVHGVDCLPPERVGAGLASYHRRSLDPCEPLPFRDRSVDVVILADILEHLAHPESLLAEAKRVLRPDGRLIASTGNIALFLYRLLLLLGSFPYSQRGILDETHLHLYTLDSFEALLRRSGFAPTVTRVTPIPFEIPLGARLGGPLGTLYQSLARSWRRLFAYQFILVGRHDGYQLDL